MAIDDQDINEWTARILTAENRYCQEVVITGVNGSCPYGHQIGDTFTLTGTAHAGGLCGSLDKINRISRR